MIRAWLDNFWRWIGGGGTGGLGARGERLAARYLKKQGYHLLERNLRNRFGEIDLMMMSPLRDTMVVIEVKTSLQSSDYHRPEFRVNHVKQRKLVSLASQWCCHKKIEGLPIRFDVVGVDLPAGGPPVIRHYIGAFESGV